MLEVGINMEKHSTAKHTYIHTYMFFIWSGFHQKPQTTNKLDLMPSGPWW